MLKNERDNSFNKGKIKNLIKIIKIQIGENEML